MTTIPVTSHNTTTTIYVTQSLSQQLRDLTLAKVNTMKLATLFPAVCLLLALSCLPHSLTACKKSRDPKSAGPPARTRQNGPQSTKLNEQKLNVLILTIPAPGHISVPLALAEELVRRGHNVMISTSGNKTKDAAERLGITFKSSGPPSGLMSTIHKTMQRNNHSGVWEMIKMIPQVNDIFGREISQFIDMIQDEVKAGTKWDVIMSTDLLISLLPCLAGYLDIPALMIGTTSQVYPHTYPPWPFPSPMVEGTNDDMTFLQRLIHGIERVAMPQILPLLFYSPVKPSVEKLCPKLTKAELTTAPAIYIPNLVPTVIGFEFSRTMTPLTHYVGPIQSQSPAPLSQDLEAWLESKEDKSVIYISMGSLLFVTEQMAKALVDGIQRTNYSVVWALRKTDDDYQLEVDPERFYIDRWLPQAAILGHRAVAIAILHCGANGVHESLHSGVPVIGLPDMTEQKSNAGRVHHHRLGIKLNKDTLIAEQIYESIVEIDSGDYRENVAKLQKVFRQAGGAKRAADLIEFYSEVGYDHLIPAYAKYQWTWVQYYNADVYALLLLLALFGLYIDYRILKCIYSRCCRSKKEKKD